MSRIPSDPEPEPIESALARLKPTPGLIDRDRLMFQAGERSARADARRPWAWPSIAAALALVAVSESVVLAVRPVREVVVQAPAPRAEDRPDRAVSEVEILVQTPESRSSPEGPPSAGGPLSTRRLALRHGLEGLPDLPPLVGRSGGGGDSAEPLRRFELNKVMNLGGPS